MLDQDFIAKTRFLPPRLKSPLFPRPALKKTLMRSVEYPLTLLQGGPGYGKSTLLAEFCRQGQFPYAWYSLGLEDGELYTFFLHLIHCCRTLQSSIGAEALELIPRLRQDSRAWNRPLELLINDLLEHLQEDTLLILDDYHMLEAESPVHNLVERLITLCPHKFHLILSTRKTPVFQKLAQWRATDGLLEVEQRDLALTQEEVAAFFQRQGQELSPEEANAVYRETEGWILALHLVWQNYTKGQELEDILARPRRSLPRLFDYLAQEILAKQSPEIQDFLKQTSPLRYLEEEICNHITGRQDSGNILTQLLDHGLLTMIVEGQRMYYHPLFREFLLRSWQEEKSALAQYHLRAAHLYQDRGDIQQAMYHLLQAGEETRAAQLLLQNLESPGQDMPRALLQKWLGTISPATLGEFPRLLLLYGDVCRHESLYTRAQEQYSRALSVFRARGDKQGMIHAYQKLAMVYLDTVEPAKAQDYIQEALALQEEQELMGETNLLGLLAENRANQGAADEARRLFEALETLGREAQSPLQKIHLRSRLFLRTGQFKKAIRLLEGQMAGEKRESNDREPGTHRESPMVLSLIHSFQGEWKKARKLALQGLKAAREMNSPFTEAVGYMRWGHSFQLQSHGQGKRVTEAYTRALELMDITGVERGRAEALWGLTLFHGCNGDLARALNYGEECHGISLRSGDEWMANQGKLSLGIAYYHWGQMEKAFAMFHGTLNFFHSMGDHFGVCVSRLWLALILYDQEEMSWQEEFKAFVMEAREQDYQFLWQRPTFLGPRDPRILAPLQIQFCLDEASEEMKGWLRGVSGLRRFDYHPGFTLHINALGPLQVFRGGTEITDRDWKREKAKELFQLFLSYRKELLPKEKIFELLWPGQSEETAGRDFKVALNALNAALEPKRRARKDPFFIQRSGQAYGLHPESDYILDVELFVERIRKALNMEMDREEKRQLLEEGLHLYRGDFLSFSLYQDWLREEREQLRRLFFQGSEALAYLYLEDDEPEKALEISENMLDMDNCWEVAYQLAMASYLAMGHGYLAQKMYLQCVETLEEELGVEPLPGTQEYMRKVFEPHEIERMERELNQQGGGNRDGPYTD